MILTPLQKYKKDLRQACQSANTTDWFLRYINKSRGQGNTDALIKACKQSAATLIVQQEKQAEEMREMHKIKAVHIGDRTFSTMPSRSVVDNSAILKLVQESMKLQMLAEQLLTLMDQKGID